MLLDEGIKHDLDMDLMGLLAGILDPDCLLIGHACRVCRIWLDRVVISPLLYQTRLHT